MNRSRIGIAAAVLLSMTGRAAGIAAAGAVDQANLLETGFGWTAMSHDKGQTFQPGLPKLTAVDIDLLTANPQLGDDTIAIEIRRNGAVLSTASQSVPVGFEGLLHFELREAVSVHVGETYEIHVPGSKDTFGWKYSGGDRYPGGIRLLGGVTRENTDWLFQTYGIPEPASVVLGLLLAPAVAVRNRPQFAKTR